MSEIESGVKDSMPDVLLESDMTVTETVYFQRKPVGQIFQDDDTGLSWFKPCRDRLHSLRQITWTNPVQCREEVLAFAETVLEVD